ncbi:MAG TPA: hypothetical protein PK033_10235 [Acetivibrio sp.]|jgi:hypothetical protein|nr:hypothetical protein [Clostridium sp.]HOQ36872.1 hypothetical protein [Acetivibrio sp.]HPT89966.1 hypothetical protein [Acetivibrio sp.]HQA58239.1 hypothetical protein [Acetivibrio sp.]
MVKYIKKQEELVKNILSSESYSQWEWLLDYHKTQIEFIQHERLIHLLVTLFFGLFFLTTTLISVAFDKLELLGVAAMFLILLIPYIAHYYKLENGVQRLYELYNRIDERCRDEMKKYNPEA